jgi:hypothetical protein
MVGGVVDAPVRRARIGVPPGRTGGAGADEVAGPGRIFVGRVQRDGGAAALALTVVERGEVAAVAPVARKSPALTPERLITQATNAPTTAC